MRSLWSTIKDTGVIKKLTIYAAGAWAAIEVLDFFASRYEWSPSVVDVSVAVLVSLIPFLVIWILFSALGKLGWLKYSLLTANIVVAGFFVNHFLHKPRPLAKVTALDESASLLVLPFKAVGDSVRDTYFSEGVTSSLINELTRLGNLSVLSELVSASYRNKAIDLKELANSGVTHVIGGNVQKLGKTVRIMSQLIDTKTGLQVWADQFENDATDIFKMYDNISRNIVKALKIKLTGKELEVLNSEVTSNLLAYDLYLKAKFFINTSLREKNLDSAIHYLENAVALDPKFAKGYAELANVYAKHYMFITDLKTDYSAKAYVASEKALELDSTLAECYYARAYANWTPKNKFQHEKAIADLNKALKINPKYADALNQLAKIYLHIGLTDEGLEILKKAKRYDPLNGSVLGNISSAYFFKAEFEKMIEAARQIPPGIAAQPYYRTEYALALMKIGKDEEAEKIFLEGREKEPNDLEYKSTYAVFLAKHGRKKEAKQIMDELEKTPNKEDQALTFHHATYFMCVTYALLGENTKSLKWLTWTVENGFPSYTYITNDPFLASLKSDPNFVSLLNRLKTEWEGFRKLANG